ncbi:MAG: FecR domain-containing protein [Acidobacteriota bacterium]
MNTNRDDRDWYSISTKSIRRSLSFSTLFVLLIIAWVGFNFWEAGNLKTEAEATIEEGASLTQQLEGTDSFVGMRDEHGGAWDDLERARASYDEGDYAAALDHGTRSVLVLRSLLRIGRGEGDLRFLSVEGSVEYRRGERGAWKRGRSQDRLNPGDWVKTDNGASAEIVFPDGTIYTLRQNTMVHLGSLGSGDDDGDPVGGGREERATDLVFGWVELNTADRSTTVTTPASEATVRRSSEALVAFDRERNQGRFAAFRGQLDVTTEGGEQRTVNALEQVEQTRRGLSRTRGLLEQPKLVRPATETSIDLDRQERLQLSWETVSGASRYALRVARNRLFASTVIENVRRTTSATLGLRGEGSFYWQVAAVDGSGVQGPWSEPRIFRIAALRGTAALQDTVPPPLVIDAIEPFGPLVMVRGSSEPGASVVINGEAATVNLDGTFEKTVQMDTTGWVELEIIATDIAGNRTQEEQRVFVDDAY